MSARSHGNCCAFLTWFHRRDRTTDRAAVPYRSLDPHARQSFRVPQVPRVNSQRVRRAYRNGRVRPSPYYATIPAICPGPPRATLGVETIDDWDGVCLSSFYWRPRCPPFSAYLTDILVRCVCGEETLSGFPLRERYETHYSVYTGSIWHLRRARMLGCGDERNL